MDKSRSTPRTNLSNKSFHIGEPSNIDIDKYNKDVSDLSRQGESCSSVTPDQQFITCNNKIKKTPDISVIIKEPIGDTVKPIKIPKEGN